jgi:predicted CXXCH cytochrome family protein
MRRRRSWLVFTLLFGLSLALAAAALVFAVPRANAAPDAAPLAVGVSNEYCLECHGKPDQLKTLPSGETLYLTIDPALWEASVHGAGGYACVQCHTDITTYPHPEFKAQDRRDVTLQLYPTCKQCHSGNYERTLDSVHQQSLDKALQGEPGGNKNAAVCADCHNPHYQTRLTNPDTREILSDAHVQIPQTCARCHSAIYDQYKESVHGKALLEFINPDVPTCIDCHGVHNIQNPTTEAFRVSSPQLCARCHTDPARMDKYGISTQVLNTYLADFHGETVTLFQKQSPDRITNKPVCVDCHGIHNISRPDDPQKGLQVKENLLKTCQKCHPDATTNFPDAWLSHYVPSPEKNSLVYYVNLFYRIFIPTVIGGMVIFVAGDIYRRLFKRGKGAA